MTLTDAISKVHAPKGMTSVLSAFLSGDFAPVRDQDAMGAGLEQAKQKLADATAAQANAKSDWAWWGFAGDVAYWRCIVSLMEAANIVGADNLPDVPLPKLEGAVMDVQYMVEKWGEAVLLAARKAVQS